MLYAQASMPSTFVIGHNGPSAKPRRRFFGRRWLGSNTPLAKLPRPLRRLARQLKFDSEQQQLLRDMQAQLESIRMEFWQRRTQEAGHWLNLLGAQKFESESAMGLLRGHSRWLEEKLAECIMHYSSLHATLNPGQREHLVHMMSRYLWGRSFSRRLRCR